MQHCVCRQWQGHAEKRRMRKPGYSIGKQVGLVRDCFILLHCILGKGEGERRVATPRDKTIRFSIAFIGCTCLLGDGTKDVVNQRDGLWGGGGAGPVFHTWNSKRYKNYLLLHWEKCHTVLSELSIWRQITRQGTFGWRPGQH